MSKTYKKYKIPPLNSPATELGSRRFHICIIKARIKRSYLPRQIACAEEGRGEIYDAGGTLNTVMFVDGVREGYCGRGYGVLRDGSIWKDGLAGGFNGFLAIRSREAEGCAAEDSGWDIDEREARPGFGVEGDEGCGLELRDLVDVL